MHLQRSTILAHLTYHFHHLYEVSNIAVVTVLHATLKDKARMSCVILCMLFDYKQLIAFSLLVRRRKKRKTSDERPKCFVFPANKGVSRQNNFFSNLLKFINLVNWIFSPHCAAFQN